MNTSESCLQLQAYVRPPRFAAQGLSLACWNAKPQTPWRGPSRTASQLLPVTTCREHTPSWLFSLPSSPLSVLPGIPAQTSHHLLPEAFPDCGASSPVSIWQARGPQTLASLGVAVKVFRDQITFHNVGGTPPTS